MIMNTLSNVIYLKSANKRNKLSEYMKNADNLNYNQWLAMIKFSYTSPYYSI